MKQFSEEELKATINRSLDDTACPFIKRGVLAGGGSRDWEKINTSLAKWEAQNFLEIIKYPEKAESGEICVKMLSYIDRKSAIPRFLNYD